MPEQPSAAFISYCRDDSEFALRLAQDLKAAGARVWLDQLDIVPGQHWDNAIEDALLEAAQMLIVLSPASARSNNVRDEISYALEQGKIIIPVLYMDCAVPLRLQRMQRIDFRADYARGLASLLHNLHVANPNQAVLDKAAEGDAQRQAAWKAREAEAARLRELELERQGQEAEQIATQAAMLREKEAAEQRKWEAETERLKELARRQQQEQEGHLQSELADSEAEAHHAAANSFSTKIWLFLAGRLRHDLFPYGALLFWTLLIWLPAIWMSDIVHDVLNSWVFSCASGAVLLFFGSRKHNWEICIAILAIASRYVTRGYASHYWVVGAVFCTWPIVVVLLGRSLLKRFNLRILIALVVVLPAIQAIVSWTAIWTWLTVRDGSAGISPVFHNPWSDYVQPLSSMAIWSIVLFGLPMLADRRLRETD